MVKRIINVVVLIFFLAFLFFVVKQSGNLFDIFNPGSWYFIFILVYINLYNTKLRTIARKISQAQNDSARKEFSMELYNSRNSIFHMVMSILLLFVVILLVISNFSWITIIFASIILIASVLLMVLAFNSQKVLFSNSGIEFQSLLFNYECGWNDISEIASFAGRGDAIVLKNVTFKKSLLSRSLFDYKLSLSAFDARWKQRVIGRIIKQNALFLEFLE